MNVIATFEPIQQKVLLYLKNAKLQNKVAYDKLMLFSVKPNDIIKYIERPDDCGNWPLDYVYQVEKAITKISERYLIDFPTLDAQTEEERVLSKFLKKHHYVTFGAINDVETDVTTNHVIAYMQRSAAVYLWNADFVLRVQKEVERMIKVLL